jgi:hypothetical protein
MIHYKETYISVKGHVWEISSTVVIYNACHFVGKCSKAEYVGNGFVLNGGWLGRSSCSSGCMRAGMVVFCAFAGGSSSIWGVMVGLGVVLRIPLHGCFRCPFAVAGLAMRYLCTMCASRWGAPLRKPTLMALSNEAMGGLQKLWCANFTLLILAVHTYEKPADSITWLCWEQFKLRPNRCWVLFLALFFVRILIETLGWSLQSCRVLLVVSIGWWLGLQTPVK